MAFFYKPRHTAPSASGRTARKMLAIVPVLAVALVGYAIAVFAWYQAGVVNTGNTIRTGSFAAQVEIRDGAGQSLWSSADENADGIVEYGEPISFSGTAGETYYLSVSNADSSTLAFQYRVALVAGGSALSLTERDTAADQLLELGEAESYSFTMPQNTPITLEFRTAFRNSTLLEIEVQQAPDSQQANGVSNGLPAAPDASDNTSVPAASTAPSASQQPTSQEPAATVSQAPVTSEPAVSSAPETSSAPTVSSAPAESADESQPVLDESVDDIVSGEAESDVSSAENQLSQPESGSDD